MEGAFVRRPEGGDRVLLEGNSGCGKSTFAALLSGLRRPESGLLLAGGLDHHTLGNDGWRRRIAAAPQFHENHVLTGTFAFNLLMGRRWPPTEQDIAQAESLCRELVEFLKSLGVISDHLRAFLELKEELVNVNSLQEYEDIVSRLSRAKGALASFPVARRIAKEIRELNERLPAIRQQDETQRQFRLNARILDLEQNPRRCPRRHPMVIREGTRGHFWGCSRYPFCSATAQLTPEENHLLNP